MVMHDLRYSFWHLVHSRTHSFVKIITESGSLCTFFSF